MKSKFDELDRTDLLKICLQQEDELERLRPAPAKYKVGQVLAYFGGRSSSKNPYCYFCVASAENRYGKWHYKAVGDVVKEFLEVNVRSLTPEEINGALQPEATAI